MASLQSRAHIQNFSDASSLQHHWGYADRVIPCTNDAGSCEYLDVVYHSHDLGMLYTGILWATIGGILLIWGIGRHVFSTSHADQRISQGTGEQPRSPRGGIYRLKRSIGSYTRRYLLPDSIRPIFGRTTRQQVLILVVLTGYLAVWSFVGIVYKTWITPVKKMPGVYNTRTSLGPWADRVGVLAYALTPLSIMLSSRESLLSLITGVPYHHFNFLHRWLGYIIWIQSTLHTIGWCIIEGKLYQPQPSVGAEWISELYMIWGVVAFIFLTFLFVLSTPWAIKLTGYEFFRKAHYILAMLYIGGCWAHWSKLVCWMIPSLVIWFIDRGIRLIRTAILHYNYKPGGGQGFQCAKASISHFPDAVKGDIVRLDFKHPQDPWQIGQHFYLCFPEGSIWQSHPFTPLSLPGTDPSGQIHSYILRAKQGETKKLAELCAAKITADKSENNSSPPTASVILTGPYGESTTKDLSPDVNVLCIAGGTGVAYVLPVLLKLATQTPVPDRQTQLIWAVRRKSDVRWIQQELNQLTQAADSLNLTIHIFVTREDANETIRQIPSSGPEQIDEKDSSSTASSSDDISRSDVLQSKSVSIKVSAAASSSDSTATDPKTRHPDLSALVNDFVNSTVRGSTTVFASGPGGMVSDLRSIVASCNSGSKVWKGSERFDVTLKCDDRLEW